MRTALADRRPVEFAEARAKATSRAEMARLLGVALNTVDSGLTRYKLPKFGRFCVHADDFKQRVIAAALSGKSYDAIAKEFDVTRGQVAGFLHRAGVKIARFVKPKKEKVVRNLGTRITTSIELSPVPFEPRVAPVEPLNILLLDLEWHQCRHPYGDEPATMTFCGHTAQPGQPYCAAHCAINYRTPEDRTRASRPR